MSDNNSLLNPSTKLYRFIVLFFASMLTFGSYFAYDIIGGIAPTLVEQLPGGSRETVSTLYTAYSIAAILALLVGGIMVDRLGVRLSSLIFSVLVLVGSLLVAFAQSLPVLFIGRFVFGAGAEPLVVAQSAIMARWFKGKELALAFGVALTVSRLGTLFSLNTGELIAKRYKDVTTWYGGYRAALMAAVLFCVISLIANFIYNILDKRGEKALQLPKPSSDKIVFSEIKNFKPSFWYISLICVAFYSAIFPFTALSTDFFVDKWHIARTAPAQGGFFYEVFSSFLYMFSTAGGISSIIIFASMVLAPFAGHLLDKFGKRASIMIIGSLILIPSHLVMAVTNIYPAWPMMALGAAFVLVPAAMWPAIPLVVKAEQVGTAFGICTMIQNIGLALFPYLNGMLRDKTKSYTASMLMFVGLGVLGLIFSIMLKLADRKANDVLDKP